VKEAWDGLRIVWHNWSRSGEMAYAMHTFDGLTQDDIAQKVDASLGS
jgi:hypothetical protein